MFQKQSNKRLTLSEIIVSFAKGAMSPILLFYIGQLVDAGTNNSSVLELLMILLGLYVLKSTIDMSYELLRENRALKIDRSSGEEMFGLMKKISVENFELVPSTSNSAYFLDKFASRYRVEYFQSILGMISAFPSALGYLWIISNLGIFYSFASVLITVFFSVMLLLFTSNESQAWDEAMPHLRFCKYLSDILTTRGYYSERKVFSYLSHLQSMWMDSVYKFQKIIRKANMGARIQSGGIKFLSFSGTVFLLWLAYVKNSEAYSSGVFVSAAMALWSFTDIVDDAIFNTIKARRQMRKCREHYSNLSSFQNNVPGIILEDSFVFEHLRVDHVSYTYPGQSFPAVNDVSFEINKGESFALVGANGSGKSTLVKIILGFLTPTRGNVYLNGIDIANIEKASLYRVINAVLQETTRFEVQISKQFGPFFNKERITQVLEILSEGENFIHNLPEQENTIIGEKRSDSVNISGGEWQRLAVTRLILSSGSLFILDEPTANLDAIAEQRLYGLISKTLSNRASLMITHRLGSTRNVKTILVMDRGEIVEIGNHASLLRAQGFYYRMYETQKANYIFEE